MVILWIALCACGPVVVVGEGPEPKTVSMSAVLHGAGAHELERRAAAVVAQYLKAGDGKPLPVRELSDGDGTDNAITVGRAATRLGLLSQEDRDWCGREGFVISSRDNTITIAGATPVGTLFGAQTFIERQARLRPDKKEQTPPRVVPEHHRERPTFLVRRLYRFADYKYRYQALPDPRQGADPELFEDSDLFIDHTAGYLVPRKLYFKDHPEYFALRRGKRTAERDLGVHLCLSNPAVTRISIERMDAWMRKNPEDFLFPVTSGDWSAFCQCEECHKLDPPGVPEKSYDMCTRELHWVNGVARAMAERHPEKRILCFAYAATRVPPPVARPESNVWVSLAIWRFRYPLFFDHVMARRPERLIEGEGVKLLERWVEIVPDRLCVFEYPPNTYEPVMLENTASRIRFLAGKGVRGISICYGNPASEDFAGLFHHIYSRLMWNPKVDVYAEAARYLDKQYGPGGKHLLRYFELCRHRYRQTLQDETPLDDSFWPVGFYSGSFVDAARGAFEEAAQANRAAPALRNAVQVKEFHFLYQVLSHLPRDKSGKVAPQRVTSLLSRLSALAQEAKLVKAFMSLAGAKPESLEKQVPGCGKLVVQWVSDWHERWMNEMMKKPDQETDAGLLEGLED